MPKESLTRHQFLKFAGTVLAGGALAACTPGARLNSGATPAQPTSTAQPAPPSPTAEILTRTAASQPVDTPAPYYSDSQSPDPSPTASISSGEPPGTQSSSELLASNSVEQDVLTVVQKQRLYLASMQYLASTQEQGIQIARSLAYVRGDGHPANMCGPLAIAILRDAGLVSKYTDLHDFWLLDPRETTEIHILEEVFPRDRFLWFQTRTSVADFDFKTFPLKAGDFLYLYAGKSGNFEHMLTVSRVDAQGRAFSVTNFGTDDGYLIQEVMLYDPALPGVGILYDWLNRQKNAYFLTGFGGFDLWRFSVPVPEIGPEEVWLAGQIDTVIDRTGGDWRICIQNLAGQSLYWRKANQKLHAASVIKVPIAMLFFKSCEASFGSNISDILADGIDGRTFDQLLRAMLVYSEEDAALSLLKAIQRNGLNWVKTLESWGLKITNVQTRKSTAEEMVKIFRGLYQNQFISPAAGQLILDWMAEFTENDRKRLGIISSYLPVGYKIYNKRGTITENYMVVADAAILTVPTSLGDQTYILDVFSTPDEQGTQYEALEQAIEEIATIFWGYTQR